MGASTRNSLPVTAARWLRPWALVGIGLAFCLGPVNSNACDFLWQVGSPAPTGGQISMVAYGNSTYVGVGPSGNLATSSDGLTWHRQCSPTSSDFKDIAFGNSLFIATSGSWGYFRIHESTDGLAWRTYSLDTLERRVVFSRFLFAGECFFGLTATELYCTRDGLTWTVLSTGQTVLQDICFGQGMYLAVDRDGRYYTSTDASSWFAHAFPYPGDFTRIVYGGGVFVAVAYGPSSLLILTSPDAANWTLGRYSPYVSPDCIALYGAGRFVLLSRGTGMWSWNGSEWNNFDLSSFGPASAIWTPGAFLGFDSYGHLLSSADGILWEDHSEEGTYLLIMRIAASSVPRLFVAVGDNGLTATSRDGRSWTFGNVGRNVILSNVVSGGGRLVAVGTFGSIFTSADGVSWQDVSLGIPQNLRAVAYGAGTFVAGGDMGVFFSSPDGVSWTARDTGLRDTVVGIAYGNGRFVAVSEGGAILDSVDGLSWSESGSPIPGRGCTAVAFGNGVFVVGEGTGLVLLGSDGEHWQEVPVSGSAQSVVFAGGLFFKGDFMMSASSTDGYHWEEIEPGLGGFYSPASDGQTFVAVGLTMRDWPVLLWADTCFPVVTSASPDTLSLAGGETVTVTGAHFAGASKVRFGDVPSLSFSVISDTTIHAMTPPHEPGLAAVSVTTEGGTSRGTSAASVVFGARPVIRSVQKLTGPFRLKLVGSGFDRSCVVLVNGQQAPSTTFKGSDRLLAQGASALKAMLPKGQTARLVVLSMSTGIQSYPFSYTP